MTPAEIVFARHARHEVAGKGLARRDEIYPLIAGLMRAERTHRQARSISYRIGGLAGLSRSKSRLERTDDLARPGSDAQQCLLLGNDSRSRTPGKCRNRIERIAAQPSPGKFVWRGVNFFDVQIHTSCSYILIR